MAMSYGDEHRPIHFAVMKRSPEMVRLLMRHGANARAGHRSASRCDHRVDDRKGARVPGDRRHHRGRRADARQGTDEPTAEAEVIGDEKARAAVASGDIGVAARAPRGRQPREPGPVGWRRAAHGRRAAQPAGDAALLLDFGFDPDERVSEGEGDWVAYSQGYPLWYCAALGRREMAEMLLQRGANPNVHVDSSGSAVYSAYSHKQWEMVELLRRHGGVVSADTAAIYRQTDLARQMLADEARGALAAGHRFARQAAGGGTAPLRRERRRSGDRAHGSGADRLAARRSPVVPDAGGAALLLAPHSLAVRGKSRTGSRNLSAVLPPHSGALRPQRDRRLWPDGAA